MHPARIPPPTQVHRSRSGTRSDDWVIGAVFGIVGAAAAYAAGASWWAALVAFVAVSLAVGLAVELISAQTDKPFPNDLVFTSLHSDQLQTKGVPAAPRRRSPNAGR